MKTPDRLKILRIIICLGLLAGIFFSFELWFPLTRTYPRAPFVFESPVWFERILSAFLIVSLIAAVFFRKTNIFLSAAILSLGLLIFFDQTRLQPWVYQYWLLFLVLVLADKNEDKTLALAQILIAALYFWSGVQKLNYTFSHETLPVLLAPLHSFVPSLQPAFVLLGSGIALIEIFIGFALLFRRTRNAAVFLAVVTHLIILALLIAKDFNRIVWLWNAALIVLVVISFWKSDVSHRQAFQKANERKGTIVKSIVAASVLLPALSFFGLWDMSLSGALYSGNVEVAVVRINENLFGKLPPKARESVFQTKSGGEKMLPLFEWAIAELNVPVYAEKRVFRRAAREICKLADDKDQTELIIKERPAIQDGSYKLTRISCAELE